MVSQDRAKAMFFQYYWASVPLALIFAAGCSAAQADGNPVEGSRANIARADAVQMNDVSVLYPMADSATEADDYLQPWSDARGGKLFPESVFVAATHQDPSDMVGRPIDAPMFSTGLDYGRMRAIAFRIDPCFANVGPVTAPETCQNQLRIIFQSLVLDPERASAFDGAVHAFYSLTREELLQLTSQLTKLRRAQGHAEDLGPLAVHPLMVKQGLGGAFAQGANAIVAKFAGQENLTRFTAFTANGGFPNWDFVGFDIDANGNPTPMEIATAANAETRANFSINGDVNFEAGANSPNTTSTDKLALLLDIEQAKTAPRAEQQKAFDAALRIVNPDFHSPNTIDCVSCHVAGPAMAITGRALDLTFQGNPNTFAPDPAFVSEPKMQVTTPVLREGPLNIHVFSYLSREPMIASRAINETAAIVTYMNKTVLAR